MGSYLLETETVEEEVLDPEASGAIPTVAAPSVAHPLIQLLQQTAASEGLSSRAGLMAAVVAILHSGSVELHRRLSAAVRPAHAARALAPCIVHLVESAPELQLCHLKA